MPSRQAPPTASHEPKVTTRLKRPRTNGSKTEGDGLKHPPLMEPTPPSPPPSPPLSSSRPTSAPAPTDNPSPVQSSFLPPSSPPNEPTDDASALSPQPSALSPQSSVLADYHHNSEVEFGRLLDYYGIEWEYEPRQFPLQWRDGRPTEMFTPDFYLPEFDLYIELTTMRQALVRRKNRKLRLLRALYPEVNVKLLYRRDYQRLLERFGILPDNPSIGSDGMVDLRHAPNDTTAPNPSAGPDMEAEA